MTYPSSLRPNVPDSLSDSSICITGSTGYVGRHLTQALIDNDHRPILIGRPEALPPSMAEAEGLGPWQDTRDLADRLAKLENVVVINIAGYFLKKHDTSDIDALVSGNLQFPLQIFEALAESGNNRIVNVGTTWEYDDSGNPEPANLYAVLKAANSSALQYYGRSRGLRGYNIKLNDTYGGLDARSKLMPMLKLAAQDNQAIKLHAADQLINLLFITDVIEGLLSAAADTASMAPGTIEQASLLAAETITLEQLAEHIVQTIAVDMKIEFTHKSAEASGLRGVWNNAPRLPNWQPSIDLMTGLAHYFWEMG